MHGDAPLGHVCMHHARADVRLPKRHTKPRIGCDVYVNAKLSHQGMVSMGSPLCAAAMRVAQQKGLI